MAYRMSGRWTRMCVPEWGLQETEFPGKVGWTENYRPVILTANMGVLI